MAKKQKNLLESSSLYETLASQADSSIKYVDKFKDDEHCSWEEKEALLLGRNKDQVSSTTKSQVFDPRLSTIVLERAARVMNQHATGKVQAIDTVKDKAKNILMDMVLQKHVLRNANSQFDLLTKFRMMDMYSLVYGSYASLVDYRIDDDYVGPDMWLIPIRHLLPEANSTTVEDSNYMFVDTWVTKDWLENRSQDIWKNVDKIIEEMGEGGGKGKQDNERKSYAEQQYMDVNYGGKGKYSQILLRTRYEKDRWVTYAPEFGGLKGNCVIRDIENPQGNNEIPIVVKHAFPLIDRFYGLGEFERGKTLQYALNSLWNLYLDGEKMKIFPPLIMNPNGVVRSTIKYHAGAKWLETEPNSIREFSSNANASNHFQSTFSVLTASLLNQAGTTDTAQSETVDPTLGKTPQALKMQSARESARDNWDRYMMEKTVEKTMNKFIDLLVTKQDKPINLELVEGEIEKVASAYPDQAEGIMEVYESGSFARMNVTKKDLQAKYRFDIDPGTTMKKDDAQEHQTLTEVMATLLKIPGVAEQAVQGTVRMGTKEVDFGEMFKRWVITSGMQDWEKIVRDIDPEQEQGMQFDLSAFENASPEAQQIAQMIAGQGQAMPGAMPQPMGGMNV